MADHTSQRASVSSNDLLDQESQIQNISSRVSSRISRPPSQVSSQGKTQGASQQPTHIRAMEDLVASSSDVHFSISPPLAPSLFLQNPSSSPFYTPNPMHDIVVNAASHNCLSAPILAQPNDPHVPFSRASGTPNIPFGTNVSTDVSVPRTRPSSHASTAAAPPVSLNTQNEATLPQYAQYIPQQQLVMQPITAAALNTTNDTNTTAATAIAATATTTRPIRRVRSIELLPENEVSECTISEVSESGIPGCSVPDELYTHISEDSAAIFRQLAIIPNPDFIHPETVHHTIPETGETVPCMRIHVCLQSGKMAQFLLDRIAYNEFLATAKYLYEGALQAQSRMQQQRLEVERQHQRLLREHQQQQQQQQQQLMGETSVLASRARTRSRTASSRTRATATDTTTPALDVYNSDVYNPGAYTHATYAHTTHVGQGYNSGGYSGGAPVNDTYLAAMQPYVTAPQPPGATALPYSVQMPFRDTPAPSHEDMGSVHAYGNVPTQHQQHQQQQYQQLRQSQQQQQQRSQWQQQQDVYALSTTSNDSLTSMTASTTVSAGMGTGSAVVTLAPAKKGGRKRRADGTPDVGMTTLTSTPTIVTDATKSGTKRSARATKKALATTPAGANVTTPATSTTSMNTGAVPLVSSTLLAIAAFLPLSAPEATAYLHQCRLQACQLLQGNPHVYTQVVMGDDVRERARERFEALLRERGLSDAGAGVGVGVAMANGAGGGGVEVKEEGASSTLATTATSQQQQLERESLWRQCAAIEQEAAVNRWLDTYVVTYLQQQFGICVPAPTQIPASTNNAANLNTSSNITKNDTSRTDIGPAIAASLQPALEPTVPTVATAMPAPADTGVSADVAVCGVGASWQPQPQQQQQQMTPQQQQLALQQQQWQQLSQWQRQQQQQAATAPASASMKKRAVRSKRATTNTSTAGADTAPDGYDRQDSAPSTTAQTTLRGSSRRAATLGPRSYNEDALLAATYTDDDLAARYDEEAVAAALLLSGKAGRTRGRAKQGESLFGSALQRSLARTRAGQVDNGADLLDAPTAAAMYLSSSTSSSTTLRTSARARGAAALSALRLVNLGNTCYINSVVQALVHLPAFVGRLAGTVEQAGLREGILWELFRVVAFSGVYSSEFMTKARVWEADGASGDDRADGGDGIEAKFTHTADATAATAALLHTPVSTSTPTSTSTSISTAPSTINSTATMSPSRACPYAASTAPAVLSISPAPAANSAPPSCAPAILPIVASTSDSSGPAAAASASPAAMRNAQGRPVTGTGVESGSDGGVSASSGTDVHNVDANLKVESLSTVQHMGRTVDTRDVPVQSRAMGVKVEIADKMEHVQGMQVVKDMVTGVTGEEMRKTADKVRLAKEMECTGAERDVCEVEQQVWRVKTAVKVAADAHGLTHRDTRDEIEEHVMEGAGGVKPEHQRVSTEGCKSGEKGRVGAAKVKEDVDAALLEEIRRIEAVYLRQGSAQDDGTSPLGGVSGIGMGVRGAIGGANSAAISGPVGNDVEDDEAAAYAAIVAAAAAEMEETEKQKEKEHAVGATTTTTACNKRAAALLDRIGDGAAAAAAGVGGSTASNTVVVAPAVDISIDGVHVDAEAEAAALAAAIAAEEAEAARLRAEIEAADAALARALCGVESSDEEVILNIAASKSPARMPANGMYDADAYAAKELGGDGTAPTSTGMSPGLSTGMPGRRGTRAATAGRKKSRDGAEASEVRGGVRGSARRRRWYAASEFASSGDDGDDDGGGDGVYVYSDGDSEEDSEYESQSKSSKAQSRAGEQGRRGGGRGRGRGKSAGAADGSGSSRGGRKSQKETVIDTGAAAGEGVDVDVDVEVVEVQAYKAKNRGGSGKGRERGSATKPEAKSPQTAMMRPAADAAVEGVRTVGVNEAAGGDHDAGVGIQASRNTRTNSRRAQRKIHTVIGEDGDGVSVEPTGTTDFTHAGASVTAPAGGRVDTGVNTSADVCADVGITVSAPPRHVSAQRGTRAAVSQDVMDSDSHGDGDVDSGDRHTTNPTAVSAAGTVGHASTNISTTGMSDVPAPLATSTVSSASHPTRRSGPTAVSPAPVPAHPPRARAHPRSRSPCLIPTPTHSCTRRRERVPSPMLVLSSLSSPERDDGEGDVVVVEEAGEDVVRGGVRGDDDMVDSEMPMVAEAYAQKRTGTRRTRKSDDQAAVGAAALSVTTGTGVGIVGATETGDGDVAKTTNARSVTGVTGNRCVTRADEGNGGGQGTCADAGAGADEHAAMCMGAVIDDKGIDIDDAAAVVLSDSNSNITDSGKTNATNVNPNARTIPSVARSTRARTSAKAATSYSTCASTSPSTSTSTFASATNTTTTATTIDAPIAHNGGRGDGGGGHAYDFAAALNTAANTMAANPVVSPTPHSTGISNAAPIRATTPTTTSTTAANTAPSPSSSSVPYAGPAAPLKLWSLKAQLGAANGMFATHEQQDVMELLACVLNAEQREVEESNQLKEREAIAKEGDAPASTTAAARTAVSNAASVNTATSATAADAGAGAAANVTAGSGCGSGESVSDIGDGAGDSGDVAGMVKCEDMLDEDVGAHARAHTTTTTLTPSSASSRSALSDTLKPLSETDIKLEHASPAVIASIKAAPTAATTPAMDMSTSTLHAATASGRPSETTTAVSAASDSMVDHDHDGGDRGTSANAAAVSDGDAKSGGSAYGVDVTGGVGLSGDIDAGRGGLGGVCNTSAPLPVTGSTSTSPSNSNSTSAAVSASASPAPSLPSLCLTFLSHTHTRCCSCGHTRYLPDKLTSLSLALPEKEKIVRTRKPKDVNEKEKGKKAAVKTTRTRRGAISAAASDSAGAGVDVAVDGVSTVEGVTSGADDGDVGAAEAVDAEKAQEEEARVETAAAAAEAEAEVEEEVNGEDVVVSIDTAPTPSVPAVASGSHAVGAAEGEAGGRGKSRGRSRGASRGGAAQSRVGGDVEVDSEAKAAAAAEVEAVEAQRAKRERRSSKGPSREETVVALPSGAHGAHDAVDAGGSVDEGSGKPVVLDAEADIEVDEEEEAHASGRAKRRRMLAGTDDRHAAHSTHNAQTQPQSPSSLPSSRSTGNDEATDHQRTASDTPTTNTKENKEDAENREISDAKEIPDSADPSKSGKEVKENSISRLLPRFFQSHSLELACSECSDRECIANSRLLTCPEVLFLQCQRFKVNTTRWTLEKVSDTVRPDMVLDVAPFMASREEREKKQERNEGSDELENRAGAKVEEGHGAMPPPSLRSMHAGTTDACAPNPTTATVTTSTSSTTVSAATSPAVLSPLTAAEEEKREADNAPQQDMPSLPDMNAESNNTATTSSTSAAPALCTRYRLGGIICHKGGSLHSGHYYAEICLDTVHRALRGMPGTRTIDASKAQMTGTCATKPVDTVAAGECGSEGAAAAADTNANTDVSATNITSNTTPTVASSTTAALHALMPNLSYLPHSTNPYYLKCKAQEQAYLDSLTPAAAAVHAAEVARRREEAYWATLGEAEREAKLEERKKASVGAADKHDAVDVTLSTTTVTTTTSRASRSKAKSPYEDFLSLHARGLAVEEVHWVRFNDDEVSFLPVTEVLAGRCLREGYVMWYLREDTLG